MFLLINVNIVNAKVKGQGCKTKQACYSGFKMIQSSFQSSWQDEKSYLPRGVIPWKKAKGYMYVHVPTLCNQFFGGRGYVLTSIHMWDYLMSSTWYSWWMEKKD